MYVCWSLKGWTLHSLVHLKMTHTCAGGRVTGDIRVNGFPKEQRTFARVTGYVEQSDIHSPQVRARRRQPRTLCMCHDP